MQGKPAANKPFATGIAQSARYAVDGQFNGGQFSRTTAVRNAWWRVNLGGSFYVFRIEYLIKADECKS